MANEISLGNSAFEHQWNRQLRFPPYLTLYAGGFAVWAWCAFVFHSASNQQLRAAVPFWAAFTACFFIVTRQPRAALKTVGWIGLTFSMFSLAVTIAELSGQ